MKEMSNRQPLNPSKKEKENNKNIIKEFIFCKCLIDFFSAIIENIKKCTAKYSVFCQFITFMGAITLIFGEILVLVHILFFEITFKFDYYTAIKEDYLHYLINDIEDINFNLSSVEIKSQFEDVGNLLFFKLYFEEMISLGLLDDNDLKTFPNISEISEKMFNDSDDFDISKEMPNSLYEIPSQMSKQHIDERNDSLSELAKIYYHFLPIILYEASSIKTYINQTYLIAYKIDDHNSMIENEMYFNFPRINDEYSKDNIFTPSNSYISPKITRDEIQNIEINDSFNYNNWFIKRDYNFRKSASESKLDNLEINYFHLNYHNRKDVDKSNIMCLQDLIKRKEKKYIVNIIYFISQKTIIRDHFDYSLFILNNYSDLVLKEEKYSDNQTYVISRNKITELVLSSIPSQYFQLGLREKNYNFYTNGISFDSFNIDLFSEPTDYYSTVKGFNIDIRFFSPFYFYTKLFQKTKFIPKYSETEKMPIFVFNDKTQISNICNKFNFSLYKNYLLENHINCWDTKNLLFYDYSEEKTKDSTSIKSLPYCICLPFYCLKNNNKEADFQNINEFVEELVLPEQCQNDLKFYESELLDINSESVGKMTSTKTFFFKRDTIDNQLKSFYMRFAYIKYKIIQDIKCMIICIFDNYSIKKIMTSFLYNLNALTNKFQVVIFFGLSIILVFISLIMILYNTKLMEKTIYDFKKYKKEFIKQLQDKRKNVLNENIDDDIKLNEFLSDNKNEESSFPLLKNENLYNADSFAVDNDYLIDKLFLMYCNYYRVRERNIIQNYLKNKQGNKTTMKINTIRNSNELFNFFCIISKYLPKFNLDLNMDFNFFVDSKLLNNYRKSIVKKSTIVNKEEIIPTTSIIYELLSTEMIKDYGVVTNLNFNFITNINLYSGHKSNCIQNEMFKQINKNEKEDILNNRKNNNFKIIWKRKNMIMDKIEEKFEQDDYLQLNKLDSFFNSFLIDIYHNLIRRIIIRKETNK
jgi:hypothetical protein